MACDMVVALGPATVAETTLVGMNHHGLLGKRPLLKRFAARQCPPDEVLAFPYCKLPQVRQVCMVLGSQPVDAWGFTHGLNEHRLFVGCCGWKSKIERPASGLTGPDLTRLVLERSHSATHAVEVLTELVGRMGQGSDPGESTARDSIFLIADTSEAFVVETAGQYWAVQECHQARAVSDVALIRQDWCRLAPGLATFAEQSGWWINDGSKLDFAGRLESHTPSQAFALKRWGRATLLLEQQNGHLDCEALRRLLIEHFEDTVVRRRPQLQLPAPQLHTTFSACLPQTASDAALAWLGMGPSGDEIYFPIVPEGDLPPIVERGPMGRIFTQNTAWLSQVDAKQWNEDLGRIQLHLDQETEEFVEEYRSLKSLGQDAVLARRATAFMQRQAEYLDKQGGAEARQASTRMRESDLAFVAE